MWWQRVSFSRYLSGHLPLLCPTPYNRKIKCVECVGLREGTDIHFTCCLSKRVAYVAAAGFLLKSVSK